MSVSTRATLERELGEMQDDLFRLGDRVDGAIGEAMLSLQERDAHRARLVINRDAEINDLRFLTEEKCLRLIATQQPAATDLRTIVAAMNIVIDLERMADHAAGVAKIVLRMGDEPLLKPLIDLPRMADMARDMLHRALKAFARRDIELAREVAAEDDQIDELYQQVFRELLTFMLEDPRTTTRALYLIFAGHNLERIADRTTNIAERVIFLASGEMRELNPEPPSDLA